MLKPKQFAHGFAAPLAADSVDSPIVQYGGAKTAIHFTIKDGRWGRITFEGLDSVKVSRGEYAPFPSASGDEHSFHWVSTVSNSTWLQERYDYERRHYGSAYNFGGNVDEMLTDFSHYVFSFHDQFVEVIAAGIWFEDDDTMLGDRDLSPDHPLRGLKHLEPSERFTEAGITCQVRRNPLSEDELKNRARLCSQTILEVAAEFDEHTGTGTDWSLTLRRRGDTDQVCLRSYFGNQVAKYDHIPKFETLRPTIDKWLGEVRERRRKMGTP